MRLCPKCGGRFARDVRELKHDIAGHRFRVTVSAKTCGGCAMTYLDAPSVEQGDLEVACWLALNGPAVGGTFRCMRKALGARATEIAELLGVTAETVSRWETDTRRVDRGAWIIVGSLLLEKHGVASMTLERLQRLENAPKGRQTIALDARRPGRAPASGKRLSAVGERPSPARRSTSR